MSMCVYNTICACSSTWIILLFHFHHTAAPCGSYFCPAVLTDYELQYSLAAIVRWPLWGPDPLH